MEKSENISQQTQPKTLIHALISSKLDHLNSFLYGLPGYLIKRLQLVPNNAARLITRNRKYEHITPVLKELHWLPIPQRIVYKICLTTHKILQQQTPQYLSDLVTPYKPTRSLRSAQQNLIVVKKIKKKRAGNRAFESAAATCWNNLLNNIRNCVDMPAFKTLLKTFLFKDAYEYFFIFYYINVTAEN